MAKQTLGLYRETSGPLPVRMSELLQDLLSIFSSKINNKRIQVALEVDSEVEIVAVANELRQIFANLLGNSIDAVSSGGTIRIRVAAMLGRETSGVRITIADNGVGIPQASLKKIFMPFFTTKLNLGTGLGLWISKQIVERHQGSIKVRSRTELGHSGTVASVFLPAGFALDVNSINKN